MPASRSSALVRVLAALLLPAALGACATAPALRGPQTAAAAERATEPDASIYGLYLAGETALDDGASRQAAVFLGRASDRSPEAGYLKERAFAAALLAGEVDRAADLAPTSGAGDAAAFALGQVTRAVVALSRGQDKAALDILSSGSTGEHWAAASLLRPWAALGAGDLAVASAAPAGAGGDRAVEAFGQLNHARVLERDGKPEAADAAYAAMTSKSGVFALAYGGFLERRGRKAEALALYHEGLTKDPTDPAFLAAAVRAASGGTPPPVPSIRSGAADALVGPAALLLAQKQPDAGLAYLRLALKLDPELSEGWVLVGDALESQHDLAAARDAYGHVAPASPEYATAQARLALNLQEDADKTSALKVAQAAVAAMPGDPHTLLVLADLYSDDERYADAIRVLDVLLGKVTPTTASAWRLYYQRGAAEERGGDWAAAQGDLQLALKSHPDDPEVLNYLGFAWADRGQHLDEAVRLLEKAATLQPESGAIVDSLGWAYFRLGRFHEAVRELERAASLDPADPEINGHLGDAYWRMGRRLEAGYQWRRVLTLEPNPSQRAAAQMKLAQGLPAGGPPAGGAAPAPGRP